MTPVRNEEEKEKEENSPIKVLDSSANQLILVKDNDYTEKN